MNKRKDSVSGFGKLARPVAAAVALCCTAVAAHAETPGFYVAFDLAATDHDLATGDFDAVVGEIFDDVDSSSVDKSGFGYNLAFGYQFNPYLAVEASYLDAGKTKFDVEGTFDGGEGPVDASVDGAVKVRGPALVAVASWPLNESFSLDARAGAFFAKTKISVTATADGESESASESENDTGLLFGVGATWNVTMDTGVRFGYTIMQDAIGGEDDIGAFTIGIRHSF